MLKQALRSLRRAHWAQPFFEPYYRIKANREIKIYICETDSFFENAKKVIHIGAHRGEERYDYAKRNLHVLWIEADPKKIFDLQANLRGFQNQRCFQGLLGSHAQSQCEFHIASNDGASSSVYPFGQHNLLWPEIDMYEKIYLPKVTLPELLVKENIAISDYDTLIMDVQGSELDILRGIPDLPQIFTRIQLEAADFPVYQGSPLKMEIDEYLNKIGYIAAGVKIFRSGIGGTKNCMNCRYIRKKSPPF
jgi:FkbM family methyltransferase